MAALFQLPIIFVIENNRYGMGTAVHRAAAIRNLADRACAYEGMHGWTIDGMDVLQVRKVVQAAVERARTQKLPSLIEANCYRFVGHSMSDPNYGHYRSKEEVRHYKLKEDPIKRFLDTLNKHSLLNDSDLERIEEEVKQLVDESVEFAKASPAPEAEELYTDIYAEDYPDIKRRDPWR